MTVIDMLVVLAILLCCKQEDRWRALIGIVAITFLFTYVLPFVVGVAGLSIHWLSQGDTPLNAGLLFGVIVVYVGVRFALRKMPDKAKFV